MALDIDASTVIRAISTNAGVFPGIKTDVVKAIAALNTKLRSLIVKQIKSKAAEVQALRDIRKALGPESFNLIVDGMKDSDLKSIVGKIDKYHPDQKTSGVDWRRRHLRALVEGSVQPHAPMKKSRPKRSTDTEFLFDESAGAVRKR